MRYRNRSARLLNELAELLLAELAPHTRRPTVSFVAHVLQELAVDFETFQREHCSDAEALAMLWETIRDLHDGVIIHPRLEPYWTAIDQQLVARIDAEDGPSAVAAAPNKLTIYCQGDED